jgi:hypothetical protein
LDQLINDYDSAISYILIISPLIVLPPQLHIPSIKVLPLMLGVAKVRDSAANTWGLAANLQQDS